MPSNSREYQRQYIKQYAQNSEKIECQCGVILKKYNKYHHCRNSKRHYIFKNPVPDMEILKDDINLLKELIKEV